MHGICMHSLDGCSHIIPLGAFKTATSTKEASANHLSMGRRRQCFCSSPGSRGMETKLGILSLLDALVCQFCQSTAPQPGHFEQQKPISKFWRLEVWDQGVTRGPAASETSSRFAGYCYLLVSWCSLPYLSVPISHLKHTVPLHFGSRGFCS